MIKRTIASFLLFTSALASCTKGTGGDGTPDPVLPVDPPQLQVSKVFGFDNQQRYAYCPSVIQQGTERHIWFCGTEPEGQFIDHIYYIRADKPYAERVVTTVLAPGAAGSWDDRHVCDPSVVEGKFLFEGTSYRYAMFYLGNKTGFYYNEIGIAFSNTIDAAGWLKYPQQLVRKTWAGDNDLPLGAGKAWGVGQPSVVSIDGAGKVLLTYTIGDAAGTRVVEREADLSDLSNPRLNEPVTVSTKGLTKLDHTSGGIVLLNADFAVNESRSVVYMTNHVLPNPASYPEFISAAVDLSSMPYADFINGAGTWKLIQRVGAAESGFARNHNPGIGRNAFGLIADSAKGELYYTVSRETPQVVPVAGSFAEWTYHIYQVSDIDLQK